MIWPAPIALFVHKDPGRASAVLKALAECDLADRSRIFVFCDGPASADDVDAVERVRNVVRHAGGFDQIELVENPAYSGRSRLLVDSLNTLLDQEQSVIVVEDNLQLAPPFLRFMNDGLSKYASNPNVVSVCGYSYRLSAELARTFFLPGAHCWGWGTWRRELPQLRLDADNLVDQLVRRKLIYAFDGGGAEPLTQNLRNSASGDPAAWALCWMASALLSGKLTLYPGRSFVANVDCVGDGWETAAVFASPLTLEPIEVADVPIRADVAVLQELQRSLSQWRASRNGAFRLYCLLKGLLPRRMEETLYTALIRARL